MTITTRASKGSELTTEELDGNFISTAEMAQQALDNSEEALAKTPIKGDKGDPGAEIGDAETLGGEPKEFFLDPANHLPTRAATAARLFMFGPPAFAANGYDALVAAATSSVGYNIASSDDGAIMRLTLNSATNNPEINFGVPSLDGGASRYVVLDYDLVSGVDERRLYYTGQSGGISGARFVGADKWTSDGLVIIDMWDLSAGGDAYKNDEGVATIRPDWVQGASGEVLVRSVALYNHIPRVYAAA